ncbi:MAG: 30S ribosomal protein S12 methylthiotransferase RimO [Deferribacteraceae bacterium]|jgi:ribosomal protein S12 methylthiotransferase|nr:30S ribosomal protein S12 methylthiotransferase RimO [Deferribacteraceae bacterium]
MLKVGFVSLGCAKNQVDLERIAGSLSSESFLFTANPAVCDLMIINTCGFIRPAVEEAIEAILSMRSLIPSYAKLIVLGCMTERYKVELSEQNAALLPEIDFWAGVNEREKILDYILSLAANLKKGHEKNGRFLFNTPYYAYLKISDGCDNHCSYCTIPLIRGRLRSVSADELLSEAKQLVLSGAKEIILISQDSTKYGYDKSGCRHLPELLNNLALSYPDTYFRIMYLNPDGVTPELIAAVKKLPNVLRYFDIPVQHASDRILKRMNRRSDRAVIEKCFSMIRKELPDAFIRTTVIVGFPGETEEDFEELKTFLVEMKPDYAGFFAYSPEDGTPAVLMPDRTPDRTVRNRLKILQSLQKKNTMRRLKEMKKNEIICFAEKPNEDFGFILEGRAFFQAPEVDGMLYVTDGEAAFGHGPYRAKITKIAYPDIYVKLMGTI